MIGTSAEKPEPREMECYASILRAACRLARGCGGFVRRGIGSGKRTGPDPQRSIVATHPR